MQAATSRVTTVSDPAWRREKNEFMHERSTLGTTAPQALFATDLRLAPTNGLEIHSAEMIQVTILASGSSGNAILAKAGNTSILIDAGLSAKRLQALLASLQAPTETLSGILLTHEHVDHTRD
jgi:beta-lactamase superfamily II metal-dependent hydrolase